MVSKLEIQVRGTALGSLILSLSAKDSGALAALIRRLSP
jgi:hypothetical protein